MADLRGEVDDRLRAQPAVEVVVQENLGCAACTWSRVGVVTATSGPSMRLSSSPCAPSPRSTTSPPPPDPRSAPASGSRSTRTASTPSPTRRSTTSGSTSTSRPRQAGPFGTTIAHGFLTLSLLPSFASQVFSPRDPGRPAQLRPGQGALPEPGPGRQSRLRSHVRFGEVKRPAGRQAADHRAHGRDRGSGQAGLRGRPRGPAPRLSHQLSATAPPGRTRPRTSCGCAAR